MLRIPVILFLFLSLTMEAAAQAVSREDLQRIDQARDTIASVQREQPARAESYSGLTQLRDQLEAARENLRTTIATLETRLAPAQAVLTALGPRPTDGAPAEPSQQAAERQARQRAVTEIDAALRRARMLLVESGHIRDEITDARRELFSTRIFQNYDSFLYPYFWRQVAVEGVPQFLERWRDEFGRLTADLATREGLPALGGLFCVMLVVIVVLVRLYRWLGARRREAGADATLTRSRIVRHALIVAAMRSSPFVIGAIGIWFAFTRFDIAGEDTLPFIFGLAGAALAYGLSIGALEAAFAPDHQAFRLIRTDDATATRAVRLVRAMVTVHLIGLVLLGMIQAVSGQLVLTAAVIGVSAILVIALGVPLLRAKPASEEAPSQSGLITAPLHLLRPLFWVLATAVILALAFGYIALAGLIVGRALASVVILCLAIILYGGILAIFTDAVAPGRPANRAIASTLGIAPSLIDLAGTVIAGFLRVAIVAVTVLVLLSPWGVEFGNVNPFEDIFFGVRFGDMRGWIGSAGIAGLLFVVGLLATRLFVAWLEGELLPRTRLSAGVSHSTRVIASYVGFALALTIALAQAGVQLQNVALVAGALSVGIGFGLQQIVQNFVAGLIVLAERPLRVGDTVVVKDQEGEVKRISVRATEILINENSTVIVPNADVISSTVKNRTLHDVTHRAAIRFVVMHDADLARMFAILDAAARAHPNVLVPPDPFIVVKQATEAGIEVSMSVMVDRFDRVIRVCSDLYLAVLPRLKAEGIVLAGSLPAPVGFDPMQILPARA